MFSYLLRLHNDESGQYSVIALFGAVPFAMLLVQILNVGSLSMDRMKAQNAADAIALTHANWTARSLNVVAMNNTTMSQTITVGVTSAALDGAAREAFARGTFVTGYVALHGVKHCGTLATRAASLGLLGGPVWLLAAQCAVDHTASAAPAALTILRAKSVMDDFDPANGIQVANKTIKSLTKQNEETVNRAQRMIGQLLSEVAKQNGASNYFVYHNCNESNCSGKAPNNIASNPPPTALSHQALPLPLVRKPALEFLEGCTLSHPNLASMVGIDRAFSPRVIYQNGYTTWDKRGYAKPADEYPFTHGGSEENQHLRDHIVELTKISQTLYAFDQFYRNGNKVLGKTDPTGFLYFAAITPGPKIQDKIQYYKNLGIDEPSNSSGGETYGVDVPENFESDVIDAGKGNSKEAAQGALEDLEAIDLDAVDENDSKKAKYTPKQKQDIKDQIDGLKNAIENGIPLYDSVPRILLHLAKQEKPSDDYSNNFFRRLKLEWGLYCILGGFSSEFNSAQNRNQSDISGGSFAGISLGSVIKSVVSLGGDTFEEKPTFYFLKDRPLIDLSQFSDFLPLNIGKVSDAYKPLIFVHRDPTTHLGAGELFSTGHSGNYAVAQGLISNEKGFDLYSQEWQGGLSATSRISDLSSIVSSMERTSARVFDQLSKTYKHAVSRDSSWVGDVHAH